MTVAVPSANRAPHPSSLADVLDLVLDKGIVICCRSAVVTRVAQ